MQFQLCAYQRNSVHPNGIKHDANLWSDRFHLPSQNIQFNLLEEIFSQTKDACRLGYYLKNGDFVEINSKYFEEMQRNCVVIIHPKSLQVSTRHYNTKITIYNDETFDVAQHLIEKKLHPVVLNMADKNHPCGAVEYGSPAQEENLCRRSTYFFGLHPKINSFLRKQFKSDYFIPEFGAIYTPKVQVIRAKESLGYPFIKPFCVDIIASAAYICHPDFSDAPVDSYVYERGFKEKIRSVLRIAIDTGHDSIVLGAWGCGAFRNDPVVVSVFFKEVIKENEFDGRFIEIAFAIIDKHKTNNFKIFHQVLSIGDQYNWTNGEFRIPVPRHREVNKRTAKGIIKEAEAKKA